MPHGNESIILHPSHIGSNWCYVIKGELGTGTKAIAISMLSIFLFVCLLTAIIGKIGTDPVNSKNIFRVSFRNLFH